MIGVNAALGIFRQLQQFCDKPRLLTFCLVSGTFLLELYCCCLLEQWWGT